MKARRLTILSSLIPLSWYVKGTKHQVLPIFYHAVGDAKLAPYLKGLYHVPSAKKFEADLDLLLKYYSPIDLHRLIRYVNGEELTAGKKYFFLSFDDGLKECIDVVAPILNRKGVPATFFVNPGFVGKGIVFHRFIANVIAQHFSNNDFAHLKGKVAEILGIEPQGTRQVLSELKSTAYNQVNKIKELKNLLDAYLGVEKDTTVPYMDKADIKKLISDGFTIGAHSMDHPEYYLLDEEAQLDQTVRSIKWVVETFNLDYKVFAFPFTDVGVKRSFFKELEKQITPDLTFGTSGLKKDPITRNIQRIAMDDSFLNAKKRLQSEFLYFLLKKPLGRNVYKRK